jgi:DNA-binding NarL/FixJ family response regulator
MVATASQRKSELKSATHYWRQLPPRMRMLFITTRQKTGEWLVEALSAENTVHVELEQALGTAAGLARLRDEVFDAVLVTHLPGELDALDLVEGYRTGGAEEPIIILGSQSEQELTALCYEVGADAYLCVNTATTRNLIWATARAIQRHELMRENHRLNISEQTRLQREHDEADRLLKEQRALIGDLEALRGITGDCPDFRNENGTVPLGVVAAEPPLPDELYCYCRELLRTYIIMGSGNLGEELKRLAELLVNAGLSARQTMQLHLKVLEELIRGLGARSTRHVMTRADLLVLEVMVHLAEGYQRRYEERAHPPRQLSLPGFDEMLHDEGPVMKDEG